MQDCWLPWALRCIERYMGLFESGPAGGIPRRALLIMPFAFLGLVRLSSTPDEPDEEGGEVLLTLFSDSGERTGEARVKKLEKTDEEWRKNLAAAAFAVTRRG